MSFNTRSVRVGTIAHALQEFYQYLPSHRTAQTKLQLVKA